MAIDVITLTLAKAYADDVAGNGVKGEDGDSAYELAVKNGYEGTEQEWLESLSGIYIGSGEMPENYYVQIDPNGEADFNPDNYATKKELNANTTRITNIEKDYLKSQDKTELADQIEAARQSAIETILGGIVDADFDTLKEVAAWIQADTTDSAKLITRVTSIESDYLTSTDKGELQSQVDEITEIAGGLPIITAEDNNKFLKVVDGKWQVVEVKFSTIYTGNTEPASDLGTDGDLYIQTE